MILIFLWAICLVTAVVSTVTLQIVAAIFWWAVVIWGYIWWHGWDRVKCKLGWHDWDKYNGYHEERVAKGAHCRSCGKEY